MGLLLCLNKLEAGLLLPHVLKLSLIQVIKFSMSQVDAVIIFHLWGPFYRLTLVMFVNHGIISQVQMGNLMMNTSNLLSKQTNLSRNLKCVE